MKRKYRLSLSARLLLLLSATAAFSTALALAVQDRALSGDLQRGAQLRADRAAKATELLVQNHLNALRDRYLAISGTPQFRATLEVGDGPTLRYYATQLADKSGAQLIAFLDRDGRPKAAAGSALLSPAILEVHDTALVARGRSADAVVSIDLETQGEVVGRLVAVETLDEELAQWSALCGAAVSFEPAGGPLPTPAARVVRALGPLDLQVAISLEAETDALVHSRYNLLTAGLVALGLAFGASILVARSVVRPIVAVQHATDRIGGGDFEIRLGSRRTDEIGDVARAFDDMLERLEAYRDKVQAQHQELEENVGILRESQKQLASAQRLARMGSWRVDLATGEISGSETFLSIFGVHDQSRDKPISHAAALNAIHPDDREGLREAVMSCIRDEGTLRLDCRVALRDEPERILHLQAELQHDADGRPAFLDGTVQDVTDRKRSEEQIRYLAYHDSLTGLGNRLLCKERLAIQLAQARRSGQILGVIFLDLDRFKRINDTLGHSQGDLLLQGVADRIASSVRGSDFVGRRDLSNAISRLGGDEFTALVTVEDAQDLAKVARRILDALARPFHLGGHQVVITGSIGISAFPFDGDDVDALLRNADAAMYHAKDQGRNNYQFYAKSMNEVALRRLILENELRRGLEQNEFELHYQPKIDTGSGAIAGFEALMRWRDPKNGLIPPGVFIPIAEETGLIAPLGEWALREACRQIVAWRGAGTPVPISVNLSTHQFRSGDLAERVTEIVRDSGADPSLLQLEITESTLMHDESVVVSDLESLRARGHAIHVDDFGTGYSSFSYLRRLPVDALKIDRSFISEITTNESDAALTASIITMAKALRLHVIAEGVETREQCAMLEQWDCDEIQGFFYGRPTPAGEAAKRFLRAATG